MYDGFSVTRYRFKGKVKKGRKKLDKMSLKIYTNFDEKPNRR